MWYSPKFTYLFFWSFYTLHESQDWRKSVYRMENLSLANYESLKRNLPRKHQDVEQKPQGKQDNRRWLTVWFS